MKKEKTIKGKVEFEIGGVKYVGTVDLKPHKEDAPKAAYAIYGVRIDRNNKDPEAAVEYTGAAAGFTPAYGDDCGSWRDNPIFNKIKPCLVMNGEVVAYLDPENYANTEGAYSLRVMRNHGDTMVEFSKIFYRISQDERYNYVEVTDCPASLKDGFTDYAFSYKGDVKDKFYVGAYKGCIVDGKLRSLAGKEPAGNKTIGQFRAAAQANGKGYEIMAFNKLVLLQALYLIRYKSLNSQKALGKGLTDAREFGKTGATDNSGLYYGSQKATDRVKLHGIEDFWGNIWEWIDGFMVTDKISLADGNFNDKGEGYEVAAELPDDIFGIITEIYGDNKLGFIPKTANDNINAGETHFCNYGATWKHDAGYFPFFGGDRLDGANAGAFFFVASYSTSVAGASIGARLLLCEAKQ